MRTRFYEKTWFKNTLFISISTAISIIGLIISLTKSNIARTICICIAIILLLIQIYAVIHYGNEDDKVYKKLLEYKNQSQNLTSILSHMENDYKISMHEISIMSEITDKWASTINSFAKNVQVNGQVSDKAWDRVKYIDAICVYCRDLIEEYCNVKDSSKLSVGYVQYTVDDEGVEWVYMIGHSNTHTLRPNACKKETKLCECEYHYGDLIRDNYSDIEIALNNEEVLRIFHKVSLHTDLSKYTQYIAIPLYCKSGKLLGVLQIVTKNGYIIDKDRNKLEKFVMENIMPLCNLIVLADKINKGLYINPVKINKEV